MFDKPASLESIKQHHHRHVTHAHRRKSQCLAQALGNSSNYFFDMSDRWRDAFLDSLQDPIYPQEKEKVDILQELQNFLHGES